MQLEKAISKLNREEAGPGRGQSAKTGKSENDTRSYLSVLKQALEVTDPHDLSTKWLTFGLSRALFWQIRRSITTLKTYHKKNLILKTP